MLKSSQSTRKVEKMKRKFLTILLSILCLSMIVACFVSCDKDTNENEPKYALSSGEEVPATIEVEIGSLCIIPKVVNGDGTVLDFEVKAKDDSDVEINNAKFRAVVLQGYTVSYLEEEKIVVVIDVKVKDSTAPMIIVNAPEGMTVIYDSTVTIPECKVSDSSGESIVPEISVTDKDGNAVTITANTFVANVLGTYTVSYKATDKSGNSNTKTLSINCEMADLLNGFESLSDISYFADPCEKELNSEYASTGNGIKITETGTENYTYRSLYVPLKRDGAMITLNQLLKYEKLQITVYASENNELGLANATFPITAGQNIMVFTREQIQAGLKFTKGQFSEKDGFLLNLRYGTNGFWMVLDDLIGIYPRDYVPTVEADIVINGINNMPVLYASEVTLPEAVVTYNDQTLEYSVTVKDKTGSTVEVSENKFNADVVGLYTAEYAITTEGYEGYATINFICRYGTLFNDFESVEGVTYAKDSATTATKELVDGYNGHGVKITALNNFSWDQVRLPVTDEKGFVTARNFAKYDKLVFVVYVGNDLKLCTANANEQYDIKAGWNAVTFSVANFVAAGNFGENANGIYLCVNGLESGKEIIFDAIYGLHVENYEPPVAGEIKINAVNGSVIIKDEQINVPAATVIDADGNALEYEIVVKDGNGTTVTLSAGDNFTPSVLGIYELTYVITADGYDGSESIALQCKKAMLLNSFDNLSDLPYVINADTTKLCEIVNTFDGKGVKTTAPNGMSWAQVQIGAKDSKGYISWNNFKKFRKIQFVVYSSSSATFCTATNSESTGVTEGWNVVELSMSGIIAAGNFREDANGFYLCVNGLAENEYLIFDSFYGIYSDDYQPDVEVEVSIDSIDNLTAILGSEYLVPAYSATHGETELQCEIIVKDAAGNDVEVRAGKFTVASLGAYTITYKVSTPGYEGEASVTVNCKKGNLLNNFEKASDITYIGASSTNEVIEIISGNAIKVTATAAFSWARVSFPAIENGEYLTAKNLKIYQKIRFIIYSSADGVYTCNAINTEGYALNKGWNVVEFSPENMIEGFEESANGFYLCVNGLSAGEHIIFYAAYGIYSDDYVPPVAGELKIDSTDGLIALYGSEYTVPAYTAVDENGETLTCSITVTDANGLAVTVTDEKFAANVLGVYTITYTITSEGYEGEASVTVNCKKGNLLNNFEKASDITYVGASSTNEVVDALSGKAIKITANAAFSWTRVSFPAIENGGYLTVENLCKYDKIRFVIYCSGAGVYTCSSANEEYYTLKQGWNIVEFSPENIKSAFEATANGFYLCVNNVAQGDYIIMYSAEGIYADDYQI